MLDRPSSPTAHRRKSGAPLRLSCLVCVALAGLQPPAAGAAAGTLEACRTARGAAAVEAATVCAAAADALHARGDSDGAFEALMHAAEAATHAADVDAAETALTQAQQLLPAVNDPLAAHRLHRRRGLLAYHRGAPVAALGEFLEALSAAAAGEGTAALAISHNDLGVVYQKLGDYAEALDQLQRSLDLKGERDEAELAVTVANIGGLYRRLGDTGQAERFLRRALAAQQDAGQAVPAARTREELGLLHDAQGDAARAATELDAAWQAFATANLARDQMRVALHRADIEARRGDVASARTWLERARGAAAAIGRDPVLQADLLDLALAADADTRNRAAATLARNVERAGSDDPALAVDAYARLAEHHERNGDSAAALRALRHYVAHAEPLAAARHDERLDALRVRFDVAALEADRERLELAQARQAGEIERVRAQRFAIAAGATLLLAVLAALFQRRVYRQRLAADAERLRLEQRIAHARDAADALRTDLRSLAWLLDRGQTAALVFDAAGCVRGITPAAARRLGVRVADASGRSLAALVGPAMAAWAQARIEQASLDGTMDATPPPDGDSTVRCERIAREEELGVLSWEETPVAAPVPVTEAEPASEPDLRAALVRLMQTSLALWERITLKTRIELAERSGVWRVTIDEGRLRVRALDRYLALGTLPERPRWREVLRTAYFVLAELPLDTAQRDDIEAQIALVQRAAARRGAP
ncbi:tetratricopeptide repeat protein [Chiayiivirga flava]|uniref:Tetratricopeptide (TPR) repeat protein n=1 Tax=Chiayiivirga flava TaxID=659595 RepID=A0A7W8D576_9GAMM|nr:tetratricopeptide repeat protein [Chiayiivirga flava]MBB5206493.1 tetratricopeptide (TPR) repeat protein [Chiayiivirga flava]